MAVTGQNTGFLVTPGTQTIYAGSLWAWGYNGYGQLGNGTNFSNGNKYASPVQIGSLTNWSSVSYGVYSTYLIKTDGTLWSCGYNINGELGNGTVNIYYSSPIQIGSLTTWNQVSGGSNYAAAIKTDGTLWAWGLNNYGQLGNGTTIKYSSPIQIGSLTTWSQVSAGYSHVLAKKTNNTLWSWGRNVNGALGNASVVDYSSPIQIGSLTNWSQVAAGQNITAALKTDGTIWTCGYNNNGALGNGTTTHYSSPIQVGSLTTWNSVSAGVAVLAKKTDGTAWGWGFNAQGLLGNGTKVNYSSPIQIGTLNTWSKISGGYRTFAGIKTDGTLWTCGYNNNGELGNGIIVTHYSSPVQVGSLTNWGYVSSGFFNNAAIPSSTQNYTTGQITYEPNSLWGWGENSRGGVGNITNINQSFPVKIGENVWSNVYATAGVGYSWAFGIKTDGTLWAWGDDSYGQLGNGAALVSIGYSSPIQIGTGTNWKQAVGGYQSSMFVKTDGTLWGCGYNSKGELGNINGGKYSSPIQIGSLTNWSQVTLGSFSGGAVKTDGTLWTWGGNGGVPYNYGQLGNGTQTGYLSPIQIGSGTNWKQIAMSGYSTFAIKTDGTLWAWGFNSFGELGNGTTSHYSSPIQIGSLTNWSYVYVSSSGSNYALAIKTDGTLWGWGQNNLGQLGNGTTIKYSSPIQIGSLTNWSTVSVGGSTPNFAIKTDGTMWYWGYGSFASSGDGSVTFKGSSPIQFGSASIWNKVSAGGSVFAIPNKTQTILPTQDLGQRYVSKDYLLDVYPQIASATGARTSPGLWMCGYNTFGTIGNGTIVNYSSPIQVGALTDWKQVVITAPGAVNAIKTDGTLWGWGRGSYNGSIGNGLNVDYSSPVQVGALTNWKQLAIGGTAAIKNNGTLWTWGYNGYGQLGNGTAVSYSSPIQIGSLTNWKQVDKNGYSMFAVKTDGTLWVCGYNVYGQLGNGTTVNYSSPIQIGALTNWKQVAAGTYTTAAIKTDGTLWTWGYNNNGQLGNGTAVNYSSPIQIGSLTNWKQVSCGYNVSSSTLAAIKTDGTLWTWGGNAFGGLGNGTTVNYSSPIQIGALTNWKQVSCGKSLMSAIKTDGTLWTWGSNYYGQLGNGTTTNYYSPIQVGSLATWKQTYASPDNFTAISDGYY